MDDGGASRFRDVRRHDEVDSTNRMAADLARQGSPDGVVVVADHQTAGRGRWGRRWEAPPGSSLLVSVLLRPRLDTGSLPLLTLGAGIAAADAGRSIAGVAVTLKWPNDLMAGGRKVGGILTELVGDGSVVVGLGLNVNWEPPLPEGATSLNRLTGGRPVDRDALLDCFLALLGPVLDALVTPDGRDRVLDRYRQLSATVGRPVVVTTPGGELCGRATTVDGQGRLVIEADDGTLQAVSAGTVTHVREAL